MMLRKLGLFAVAIVIGGQSVAAIEPGPFPGGVGTARPLAANRPIFATSVPMVRTTAQPVGRTPSLPPHRQPLPAPAAKNGPAAGPGSAAGKLGPAPPVWDRSTPAHRLPLGW